MTSIDGKMSYDLISQDEQIDDIVNNATSEIKDAKKEVKIFMLDADHHLFD